jgi:hypothetical protein
MDSCQIEGRWLPGPHRVADHTRATATRPAAVTDRILVDVLDGAADRSAQLAHQGRPEVLHGDRITYPIPVLAWMKEAMPC